MRSRHLLASTALAAASLLAPAQAAHAAGTPTADLACESAGNAHFSCVLTISGGTAPYTTAWHGGANIGVFTLTTTTHAFGTCIRPYVTVGVSATVTDSLGASTQAATTFYCGEAS